MANKRPVIKARTSIASKDNLDTKTNGSNYESTSPQSSSSQNGGEVPFFQIMRPPSNQASSSSSYEEEQQHMTSPPSMKNQSKRSPPAVTPRKHITATVSVTLPQYQYQHSNESHHSTANSVMLSGSNPFIVRNELMTTSSSGGAASRSLDGSSSMFFLSSPSTNHLNRRHTETGRMTVSSSYENLNMPPSSSSNHFENDSNGVLRGIFTFEGKTVDLELGDTMIKWKRTNTGKSRSAEATLELKQFYNVQPFIASKSKSQSKQNLSLTSDEELLNLADGFVLHTFETDQPNSYKHRTLVFLHPHRDTTKLWIDRLKQKLPSQQVEREVLVLINPYTGEKKSRTFLNQTLMPLFSTAQIKLTIVEFHDTLPLRHTLLLNDLVFDNYYGVVVLGGDGSVSKVVNLLIELTIQRDENFDVRENSIESLRDKLKTPLCIIPTGSTNIIANSIYGTTDYNTPLMHLFYGNTIRIDLLCSTTLNSNRLHSFGFGYSCGFATSLARYMPRFSKLGLKKVQTAIARAVAKQRHRPVEVEIQYIRSRDYQPTDEIRCFKGCTVCQLEQKNVHARKTYDHVEEFDPIANSIEEIQNNLKPIIYNNHRNHHRSSPGGEEDEWEVIQGSFIHIAFLANSHYWDLASAGGLSKYAHLADGCMDLVLVDPVPRKEFFRFIRRHTNGKNQLTLPFVKTIRIKEARIKILNSSSSSSGSSASGRPESITSSMGGGAGDDDSFISFKGNSGKQMSMHNFFMADTNMDSSSRGSSRAADSSNKRVTNHFGLSSSSKPPHPPLPPSNTTNTLNGSLSDDSSIDELDLNNNNNDGSSRMDVRPTNDTGISRLPMFNLRRETPPKNNIDLNASLRSSKSPGSGLLKKSRSIVNLFRGDDHNRNNDSRRSSMNRSQQQLNDATNNVEYNAFTEYKNSQDKNKLKAPLFTSYPGKNNFTTKSSFKAPSVWNCDWNLNNIPEMNLKCLQKFLPVFGWGLDIETHFDDSAASCLPSF